eukprot:7789322-Ditylum_brightwellii.AAC.1
MMSCRHRLPLKELRTILTASLVPPCLSLFILELMEAWGSIESVKSTSSSAMFKSRGPCYNSARDVIIHLHSMISMHPSDASFEAVNQDALAERLVLASKKLYGHEKEWSALQE